MAPATTLEIWSDVACPWCWIGHARLAAALAQYEGADQLQVIWRSFELDPAAPAAVEGTVHEHLARKYGRPIDEARAMVDNVVTTAAGHGLTYEPDIQRLGNTFLAHQLIHLAAAAGTAQAMLERLWTAYFGEGRLMSDMDTLIELAAEVGLDPELVRGRLGDDDLAEAVRGDEQLARKLGISAVPCFVVDRQRAVSGAQPPQVLLRLLSGAE